MSFWDRIKPAARTPAVSQSQLSSDGSELELSWDDGVRTKATAQTLRRECPCAACVDEWTNRRTLDPASIPADLRITELQRVGNYALTFNFSDGHTTGIYPWPHLREHTQKA